MKKDYRIKRSQEIEMVMKKGKSKANPYFIVYKHANPGTDHFRLALSVGKKIGNAPERNKIKRRIRAITSEYKDQLDPKFDYFIIARKGAAELDFPMFKKNLEQIYQRMHMIPKPKPQALPAKGQS